MYFEAMLLSARRFRIVMSFWGTDSLIIMKYLYITLELLFEIMSIFF